MPQLRYRLVLPVLLFLSMAVNIVLVMQAVWGPGAEPKLPAAAESPKAIDEPRDVPKAPEILLPDDPKAVVLAVWEKLGGESYLKCEIRADGSMTVVDTWRGLDPTGREFFLSARELQDLLRYVIREKEFFAMAKDHVHLDPKLAPRVGPYISQIIRVQADGRQHEVVCAFLEAAPGNPEVANLKAILARIESVKNTVVAAEVRAPDPKAIVIALDRHGMMRSLDIRGDGSMTIATGSSRHECSLTAAALQELLRFVVREKEFFTIQRDHVYGDNHMKDIHPWSIRIQADGRQNEVIFWKLDIAPACPEVDRLKAILARLESTMDTALAAQVALPDGSDTPVICTRYRNRSWEIRADGKVVDTGALEGALSAHELQDLLQYIVRNKRFFAIPKDQCFLPPALAGDPAVCIGFNQLCVQADGRSHTVEYLDHGAGNPATETGNRLNDIVARIEHARSQARAKTAALAPKPREPQPVLELFEDDTAAFIKHLSEVQGSSEVTREERDVFSGASCLRVTPVQRYHPAISGWNFRIVEQPGAGEYRYLRFAWKKLDGQSIMLQLHGAGNSTWHHRYFAGVNPHPEWGPAIRVADKVPAQWQVVTRDLFQDFGAFELTGIALTPFDGTAGLFDHIYLAPTVEDLDRIDATKQGQQSLRAAWSHDRGEQLWADLMDPDAGMSYRAQWSLVGAQGHAVALLRERLLAPAPVDAAVAGWIRDLDDNELAVRDAAAAHLRDLGRNVVPRLLAALAQGPSLEAQRRIEGLLKLFDLEKSAAVDLDQQRQRKAIRILKQIGSAEARQVLEELVRSSSLAEEAKTALRHLDRPTGQR